MLTDLIYDVGLHNGSDTGYYLWKGYRVVAIEANPVYAQAARKRFPRELADGRLNVLNVGVGPAAGTAEFWVNEIHTEWSSFHKEYGCREGTPCHAITVPCVRFQDVLAEHGVPYYLKLDIEGYDQECLRGLDRNDLPQYISAEFSGDEILQMLESLGYHDMKCINQLDHNDPSTQGWDTHLTGPSRVTRKRQLIDWCVRFLAQRPRLRGALEASGVLSLTKRSLGIPVPGPNVGSATGWHFEGGATGPFGEETPGPWLNLAQAKARAREFAHLQQEGVTSGWLDIHARRS